MNLQDNVFVQLLCSIQYRIIKRNADDAFYELQNPKEQIQAYVFDGNFLVTAFLWNKFSLSFALSQCVFHLHFKLFELLFRG
jgi:hypothetical protein